MNNSNVTYKSRLFLFCNVIAISLGVIVLIGWYAELPDLIQVHESWVPMQYNTALGFVFCGLAGISLLRSHYSTSRFIALIPILLGGLTLIEYSFGTNLHIDEMFMKHYITVQTSHPGRMSPNTALCFLLLGISIVLASIPSTEKSRMLVLFSMVLGLFVATLAVTTLAGYLITLEDIYDWKDLTRMAVHTSLGFAFLGSGLVFNLMRQDSSNDRFALIFIAIFMATYFVMSVLAVMERRSQEEVAEVLEGSLTRTLSELDTWMDDLEMDSLGWSQLQGVHDNIKNLLKAPKDSKTLLESVEASKLDDILSPFVNSRNYQGYIIIAPDYTNIASMLKVNVGDKNFLVGEEDYLSRAFKGEWVVTPPKRAEVPLKDNAGNLNTNVPTMFSLVPIHAKGKEVIAVLAFRIDPYRNFLPIFKSGIIESTGETYIFSREGVMLSDSRFDEQLSQLKLIHPSERSMLNVQVRDPGGDLTKGFSPVLPLEDRPFTEMVVSALKGERKTNVLGYRDYRGVLVVGSWGWHEKLGAGVAIERDLDKTYARHYFARKLILLLLFSMIGLFALMLWQLNKRRRLLAIAESYNTMILNSTGEGIYGLGLDGHTTFANPAAEKMLGFSLDEMRNTSQHSLIHHTKADGTPCAREECHIFAALYDGTVHHVDDEVFWRKDGTSFPVHYISTPVLQGGEIVGAVVSFKNISDQKAEAEKLMLAKEEVEQANAKLLSSETEIRSVLNNILEPIVTINEKGIINKFNPAAEKMFGYTSDEVKGLNVSMLMPEPERKQHDSYLEAYKKTGIAKIIDLQREVVALRKDGTTFPMNLSVSKMVLDGQNIFIGALTDLTKQKKNEEMILSAKMEAERANRAKSLFLANMSHEIRTPMNAVLGYSQILLRKKSLDQDTRDALRTIDSSGKNLLKMINEILDISKIEAGKMELNLHDFDLNQLVDDISSMFALRCEKKQLQWTVKAFSSPVLVRADEGKLRQVLINILGNAVKFTESGEIKFSITTLGDNQYRFDVVDTGYGIPIEAHEKIFDAFQQEEEGAKKGGTGLGLAISKKQLELMGAELSLKSSINEGTNFYFTLTLPPVEKEVPEDRRGKHRDILHLAPECKVKALVVDDIKENRDVLAKLLLSIGVEVF